MVGAAHGAAAFCTFVAILLILASQAIAAAHRGRPRPAPAPRRAHRRLRLRWLCICLKVCVDGAAQVALLGLWAGCVQRCCRECAVGFIQARNT